MKVHKNIYYDAAKEELDAEGELDDYSMDTTANDDNDLHQQHVIIMRALQMMQQDYMQRNQTMMVKVNIMHDLTAYVIESFQQMNASFTHMYRSNVLDYQICMTKDCFNIPQIGYTVHENGTKSNLCFERRKSPSNSTKVHFNPELVKMEIKQTIVSESRASYFARNLNSYSTATEDLFAYEYSNNEMDFQKSLNAWSAVIAPLVDVVYPDIIERNMRPNQNSRPPPARHVDEIDNFEEVYESLRENPRPPLDYFVRL